MVMHDESPRVCYEDFDYFGSYSAEKGEALAPEQTKKQTAGD